jgi:hypothetical protein
MKFNSKVSEVNKVALSMLIFNTCGEDEKTLADAEITEIGANIFHVQYALDDPYDAIDFQVAIDQKKDTLGATDHFHYTVFRSVYGDNGEFDIALK